VDAEREPKAATITFICAVTGPLSAPPFRPTIGKRGFAIITTHANDLMRPIHLRMPVILTVDQERIWLSTKTPVAELLALLEPAPSDDLRAYEISPKVNRASTDTPDVMEPV
jgi:putative SOS response-associated peptidase YedK